MLTFWKKLSLTTQYASLLTLIVVMMVALSINLAKDVNVSARLNEARTVADMVENIGTWATQYKGVWIRKEQTDTKMEVGDYLNKEFSQAPTPTSYTPAPIPAIASPTSPTPAVDALTQPAAETPPVITYHQKNPALIQREVSDVTEKSASRAKFRSTSDKYMNPDNAPNAFETVAIASIRAQQSKEYYEVSKRELNYARAIIATEGCLKCHDTPEKAPAAVREKYPSIQGYGYKVGEVIGVVSVRVPLDNAANTVVQSFSTKTWAFIGAFFVTLFFVFYIIRSSLIKPLRRLHKFADDVRDADEHTKVRAPHFVDKEYNSQNEIHQLSQALKALHGAIKVLSSKK
jgi:HAMP domain-containing protein